MVRLREGLSVLVTNFAQTPEVRQTVNRLAGQDPNLVFIALAERPRYREERVEEFASWYGHISFDRYISTNEDSPHHRRLMYHASTIVVGHGSSRLLQLEMGKSGLSRLLWERINDPRPLLIITRSAGSVYMGQADINRFMVRRDTGELVVVGYCPMLGVLKDTYLFVHGEDHPRRILDKMWGMLGPDGSMESGKDNRYRPHAQAFALYDEAALLFEADRVHKVGGGLVRVVRKIDGKKLMWEY